MSNFKSYKHYYSNANKDRACECCGTIIKKGEKYSKETGRYKGELFKRDLCLKCDKALAAYTDDTGLDFYLYEEEIMKYRTA